MTFQRSTDKIPEKILPTLDKLYDEFRNLGVALNAKIEKLQIAVSIQNNQDVYEELTSMSNLRECVRAAADVVSTASSTLTVDVSDKKSVKHGSDFGDLFVQDTNETMMRWMSSNTVYEYEEMSPLPDPSETSTGNAHTEYPSDSDSDLESDIFKALFNSAKKLMEEGDLIGAERKLCNCLARLNGNASTYSLRSAAKNDASKAELLERLIEVYCLWGSWNRAKTTMMEKLSVTERQVGKKDELYLIDLLKLAEIMMKNHEYVEAHLQGRRSLRGFKKLGESGFGGYEKSLVFLVHLCNADNKSDEVEAYAALLGSHRATRESTPPHSRIDLETPDISSPSSAKVSSIKNPLDALYPAAGQPIISKRRSIEQRAEDEHISGENRKNEGETPEPTMARSEDDTKDVEVDHRMPIPPEHDTHIIATTERSDPTNQHAAPNADSTDLIVTGVLKSTNASDEVQSEVMASVQEGQQNNGTVRNTPSSLKNRSEESIGITVSPTSWHGKFEGSTDYVTPNMQTASNVSKAGRSSPNTTTVGAPQHPNAEATSNATMPHQPQVQSIQRRPVGAGVNSSAARFVSIVEGNLRVVASLSDSPHMQYTNPTKASGVSEAHSAEKQAAVPIDETEALQDMEDLPTLVEIATRYTEINATVPEASEELIVSGAKLQDPYSDKEVVAPETERSSNTSLVPEPPSLVAKSSSGVQFPVSPDQQEGEWLAMFGRLIPRSGSDSRMPRNHDIDTPHLRDVVVEASNTSNKHRRAITPTDGELEQRSPNIELAPNEASSSGETAYEETPTCPICNESLVGLTEPSKSTHVNSCIDGISIPISELRSKDKVAPTPPIPEGPVPADPLGSPLGT